MSSGIDSMLFISFLVQPHHPSVLAFLLSTKSPLLFFPSKLTAVSWMESGALISLWLSFQFFQTYWDCQREKYSCTFYQLAYQLQMKKRWNSGVEIEPTFLAWYLVMSSILKATSALLWYFDHLHIYYVQKQNILSNHRKLVLNEFNSSHKSDW